jgi:hypothetical protein
MQIPVAVTNAVEDQFQFADNSFTQFKYIENANYGCELLNDAARFTKQPLMYSEERLAPSSLHGLL